MNAEIKPARLALIVTSKYLETEDICALELQAEGGCELPPYAAGAHIDVDLPNGMTRQYSLCGQFESPGPAP